MGPTIDGRADLFTFEAAKKGALNTSYKPRFFVADARAKRLAYYMKQGEIVVDTVSVQESEKVDVTERGSERVYHLKVKAEDVHKLLAMDTRAGTGGPTAVGTGAEDV